jgi:hypothetical protein
MTDSSIQPMNKNEQNQPSYEWNSNEKNHPSHEWMNEMINPSNNQSITLQKFWGVF